MRETGVSIRRLIAGLLGLDLDELISDQSLISANGKSNGQRLEEIDSLSKDFIRTFISNPEKEPDRIIKEILSGQNFTEQNIIEQVLTEQDFTRTEYYRTGFWRSKSFEEQILQSRDSKNRVLRSEHKPDLFPDRCCNL